MSVETWFRGSTIPFWSFNKVGTTATSPDQGVKITVIDAAGATKVDDQAMTEDEEGDFVYYYTTTSSSEVGEWRYYCTSQDGTGGTAKYLVKGGSFKVI